MKERPKTFAQVADGLMALRSALNPTKQQWVWDELSFFAEDIRRLASELSPQETDR